MSIYTKIDSLFLIFNIHSVIWKHDKTPFDSGSRRYTFHSVGQKITGAVDTAAKVAGTAKTAYEVGMTVYELGTVIAPFLMWHFLP